MSYSWIRQRQKYIVFSLLFTIGLYCIFEFTSRRWEIAFTLPGEDCFGYKLWFVEKGVMPGNGEYVAFKKPGIPHMPPKITWIKKIVGVEGDTVVVKEGGPFDSALGPGEWTDTVYIHGMPVIKTVKGIVYLFSKDGKPSIKFKVYSVDSQGRPVPMISPQVIAHGDFFVTATDKRSYDSRYWGLVNEKQVLGRAYPLY